MSPRPRSRKQFIGTNIKDVHRNGKTYYYYVMPDGSKEPLIHGDEKASIEAALELNKELRPQQRSVVDRILNRPAKPAKGDDNPLLVEAINEFEEDWIETQGYSDSYLAEVKRKLQNWREKWPHKRTNDMTTYIVAQYLKTMSSEPARQHHSLFTTFFKHCASEGYKTQRPMQETIKRKKAKSRKQKHNWQGLMTIYDQSPVWLKIAQDSALYSLQRRSDLVNIRIDRSIDFQNRTIRVLQQKTENYDESVYIDIKMGPELYDTVLRSHWSGIDCPYLIHHRPERITATMRKSKPHICYVMPDYLTRAYSDIRDKLGVYDHIEDKKQRPSLHSLRGFGIWAYSKAGYSDEYIMALSGHATQKMHESYKEGHEKRKPIEVEAGLSLKELDFTDVDFETDLSPALKKLIDSGVTGHC